MVLHDRDILALCRARDQQAIAAMADQYGAYCHKVAQNILGDPADAEECVNGTYLAVWNTIPPAEPQQLLPYLAKVTRNIALHRLEYNQAQKRGIGFTCCSMSWQRSCRGMVPWRMIWPDGN